MVMLPPEEHETPPAIASVAVLPQEEYAVRQAAAVKPVAAPRQAAKASKQPPKRSDVRGIAAKKAKTPATPPAAAHEVDSDVALLSAILAHSTRHAAERAEQESCQGKKCPAKPPGQP